VHTPTIGPEIISKGHTTLSHTLPHTTLNCRSLLLLLFTALTCPNPLHCPYLLLLQANSKILLLLFTAQTCLTSLHCPCLLLLLLLQVNSKMLLLLQVNSQILLLLFTAQTCPTPLHCHCLLLLLAN
jgi:hypothetical protein